MRMGAAGRLSAVLGLLILGAGGDPKRDPAVPEWQAEPCELLPLEQVPLPARKALELQAGDGGLDYVCRVQVDGVLTAYRARGRRSGITAEVSPTGEVLWRHWEGF
jgi:hypothetical protein